MQSKPLHQGVPSSQGYIRGTVGQSPQFDLKSLANNVISKKSTVPPPLETTGHVGQWDRADWQVFYDERAGISEHDGQQTAEKAGSIAYEAAIARWMNEHPFTGDKALCGACGESLAGDVVPLTDGAWIHHPKCFHDYQEKRRNEATTALKEMGITSPDKEEK